jgi:hypothetical protein
LWRGTAESWIDLHAFIEPDVYGSSLAHKVYTSGGEIWVVGNAFATSTQSWDALLWHYVPEPASTVALSSGFVGLALWSRKKT